MTYKACVLGATGLVGQRMVSILAKHPWFDIEVIAASIRSAGEKYRKVVNWVIDEPFPDEIGDINVSKIDVDSILKERPDIIFSALPSSVALDIEVELVKKGFIIVSNASPLRMEPYIPLINPEVNADHINLINKQKDMGWKGFIVKVPNCSTAILTLPLKPIMDEFGIKNVVVSTMQAISGAGYTGVSSMAILDNIIPYIEKEEEKIEMETLKILGRYVDKDILFANIRVSASCHRVMVLDGHLEAVFVETYNEPNIKEIKNILRTFKGNMIKDLNLPTAPKNPIVVREEVDRPQPRLDRKEGNGMSVVVGRIRKDPVFNGIKLIVLGHNTIRGAAGTAVLIGELLVVKNYVK